MKTEKEKALQKAIKQLENNEPAREEKYSEETQEILEHIGNRGDQRIGQLLINAVRSTERHRRVCESNSFANHNEAAEQILWNIEAPRLLKALNNLNKSRQ